MNSLFQWMRRTIVFATFSWMTIPGFVRAAEVAGVRIDPGARVGGVDLALNGAGLRQRFMVDVYVIGLYFAERTTSAESAIDAAGPKRIALTFTFLATTCIARYSGFGWGIPQSISI